VNAVAACPTRTWVCAATYEGIAVWDIQEQAQIDLAEAIFPSLALKNDPPVGRNPDCTALTWSDDGAVLYAGYNNGEIRVWEVRSE
jgi:guanine nucleotide-binding protein subunit beta-2-like 1 protein